MWCTKWIVPIIEKAEMLPYSSYSNCKVSKLQSVSLHRRVRLRRGVRKFNKNLVTQAILLLNWLDRLFWIYNRIKTICIQLKLYFTFLILIIFQAQYSLMTLGGRSEPQWTSHLENEPTIEIPVRCVANSEFKCKCNLNLQLFQHKIDV